MVKVLLADNTEHDRAKLRALLRADAQIQIVAEAKNGAEAVSLTRRYRPQVVVMGSLARSPDLGKPVDGLEATRQIMSDSPTPIVVALHGDGHADSTGQELLQAGAVAVLNQTALVLKPLLGASASSNELVETVRMMSQVKVVGRRIRTARKSVPVPARQNGFGIVAIAASTGGPHAITRVLQHLPATLPVPVVLVQHMAPGFVRGFTKYLDEHCAIQVKLVESVERLCSGVAYVAADGAHLRVLKHAVPRGGGDQNGAFSLQPTHGVPQEGFMPSASVLFESVAEAFGERALAVILTGMGRDGLSGLAKVREHGGRILAQNQETSVVFGMPYVAIEAGLADQVLPIERMAAEILDLLRAKEPQ